MIKPLIENAMWTDWSIKSRLVMIPIVSLHISCSINELLRYMTHTPGCNLTEKGKFVAKSRPICWGVARWSIWITGYVTRSNRYNRHAIRCNSRGGDVTRCNSKGGDAIRCNSRGGDATRCNSRRGDAIRCNSRGGDATRCNSRGGDVTRCNSREGDATRCNSRGEDAIRGNPVVWLSSLEFQFVIKGAVVYLNWGLNSVIVKWVIINK